jgi:hypothetical protein
MLKGKIAGMVLRWNQNACGPRELGMPAKEEDELEEDGYTCGVLKSAPEEDPLADFGAEILKKQPSRHRRSSMQQDEPLPKSVFQPTTNPMQDYVTDSQKDEEEFQTLELGGKTQSNNRSRREPAPMA